MPNHAFDDLFDQWGRALNVDPQLTKTIFHLESSGNADTRDGPQSPDATNGERAGGGMQLLPSTARAMATRLGADPNAVNIHDMKWAVPLATAYLAEGLNATGHPSDAMAYYFAGPDRSLWGPKTASYVAKGEATYPQMALRPTESAAPAPAKEQQPQMADILDRFPMAKTAATAKPETAAPAGDILSMFPMAAAAPKAAAAEPSAGPVVVDDMGRPVDAKSLPALPESVGRIGSAIRQGWEGSQPILTPAGVEAVDQMGPLGRMIINPAARLAGAIPGALNALGSGTAQAIVEGANAAGVPGIGRDINMGMQVAPFARMGAGMPVVRGVPEAAPATRFIQEHYGEGQPGNPLAPQPALPAPVGAPAPSFIPPGTKAPLLPRILELLRADDQVAANRPAVVPPDAAQPRNPLTQPAPRVVAPAVAAGNKLAPEAVAPEPAGTQSVGAAASRDLSHPSVIGMTPAQELAYRSTAEGQKLLETQQPGLRDDKQYVSGVTPSQADIEQTVNTARELKSLNITGPGVSQEAREIADANNGKRQKHFADLAKSDVDVANAKAARSAQADKDLTATWANKTEADISPILSLADDITASPDGRRPIVRNAVGSVIKELKDAEGKPITDPEQLYGVRKHLDDLMSKEAGADDPKSVRAMANLQQMKQALDAVIEKAAPGFGQYLKNFSEASRPIDAMEVLQKHENKIHDGKGRITHEKVQTMMRQIVDSRAAPGFNPYKSIPDETMDKLWALRDDLRRSASAQELARTPGSDTVQNTYDALKQAIAGPGAEMALHAGAHIVAGPVGNAVVATARNLLAPYFSARSAAKRTARGMELLHPAPQIDVPPTNRLSPP